MDEVVGKALIILYSCHVTVYYGKVIERFSLLWDKLVQDVFLFIDQESYQGNNAIIRERK